MLDRLAIDTVLDVGANCGQFAQYLRNDVGYRGQVFSFEPLSAAFELLKQNAKHDSAWEVFHCAIGDKDATQEINISGNSVSSSLLPMLPALLDSEPQCRYTGKEIIAINPLDSIFGDLCRKSKNIYLKIDTQGYECKVLKGAEKSLPSICSVQLEVSLVPLYDGELLLPEMCILMRQYGYTLVDIQNGFADSKTEQLLQVDGFFHRL